ncbi:MAG TPA: vWA domain-containing protein [Pseudolysinimonas sp.]|nr:vWA domain-containing protein [Pseudolysinimonas sp.]
MSRTLPRILLLAALLAAVLVPAAPAAPPVLAAASTQAAGGSHPCAPLDIVLLIDTTGSMEGAISNVKSEVTRLTDTIEEESAGDYRIGLIEFGVGLTVRAPFADRNADEIRDIVASLSAEGGGDGPEAWDEALVTAVETRSAAETGGNQYADFSVPWRAEAKKMIVLITDNRPAGFDDSYDVADLTRAEQVAQRAAVEDMRIATVFVPNGQHEDEARADLRQIAEYTSSTYFETAEDGSNLTDGLTLNVETCAEDSDGDGLFDVWEIEGYDFDGDGDIDVDLPAMGASPDHKDLFLQVNWMQPDGAAPCYFIFWCPTSSDGAHPPSPAALNLLTAAFASAPVVNPDGKPGVRVHIDAGPLTPAADQALRSDSAGGILPFHRDLLFPAGSTDEDRDAELVELADAWFPRERLALFTRVLYVHKIVTDETFGGVTNGLASSIPGDTVMIAGATLTGDQQNDFFEAAILMHELGHTLGLGHGGYDRLRGKPTYPSVMNYDVLYGDGLLRAGRDHVLDYSNYEIAAIDEAALDERAGLELADPDDPQAGVFRTEKIYYTCAGKDATQRSLASAPIDWNCDGDTNDRSVRASVDWKPTVQILAGRDDWATLIFSGGQRGGLASRGEPVTDEDLDIEKWLATPREYAVTGRGPGSVQTRPGTAVLRFAITNSGTKDDEYALSASVLGGWEGEATVPPLVAVAAGATVAVDVTVEIPEKADRGDTATVSLMAQSAGSDWMSASPSGTIVVGAVDEPRSSGGLRIDPERPGTGSVFTITGDGFAPGTEAIAASDDGWFAPVSGVVGADGSVTIPVTAPAAAAQGVVRILGSDAADAGDALRMAQPRVLEAEVEVVGLDARVVVTVAIILGGVALFTLVVLFATGSLRIGRRKPAAAADPVGPDEDESGA